MRVRNKLFVIAVSVALFSVTTVYAQTDEEILPFVPTGEQTVPELPGGIEEQLFTPGMTEPTEPQVPRVTSPAEAGQGVAPRPIEEQIQPFPTEQPAVPVTGRGGGEEEIEPFGYEMLQPDILATQPVGTPLATPEYTLAPGDEVAVVVWGNTQFSYKFKISLEGKIVIPNVGVVQIGGLTVKEFQEVVSKSVKKYYKGVEVEAMLLRLRTIPVWIAGEIRRPGKYSVSPLTTVSQLIKIAGGVTRRASLRAIQVTRRNGGVATVDLYDFLMKGDLKQDLKLESGDVVLVLIHGGRVRITGEVKRPLNCELKGNEHLSDMISLVGGFTDRAYKEKIELFKVLPGGERKLYYIDWTDTSGTHEDPLMTDGDYIIVRQTSWYLEAKPQPYFVTIEGEVKFPGIYAIHEGENRIMDVLKKAGGFTEKADIRRAKFIRPYVPIVEDREYKRLKKIPYEHLSDDDKEYLKMRRTQEPSGFISVDFYKLWIKNDRNFDLVLKNGDRIIVPEVLETITLTGGINAPGSVYYQPGTGVGYYLDKVGGFAYNADRRKLRVIKSNGKQFNPRRVRRLEPGDIIWVPQKEKTDWWERLKDTAGIAFLAFQMLTIIWQQR
ncbi:MAG: SLBB domain-containing protein [Candidatus Edwardsbacteria bacterium]